MNFLTSTPPRVLTVGGTEYPINADFRAVLRYNEKIKHQEEDLEYLTHCLLCIYEQIPEDLDEAVRQINWFIGCGKIEKKKRPSNKVLGINSNTPFDFETDGELIYSAFRRQDAYGIDLHEVEYLHWWEFMAMLNDLPSDTQLSRVMEYRVIDTSNKHLSKEQRDYYQAMQRYHKIQAERDQRDEELIRALKEGRDPTPYL